ncbi:MAG: tRNA1(Val) (adenine(37)-N6)-methyltransferase [Lachnospiraceae bacterium]|nr:tRNA1(Val) (adenine(37)-N6)-methyltransferase [Lachnospiraceae bacterium]
MKEILRKNERIDDLGRKGYRIIQDPQAFCFGIDAVLLTGFAKVKKGAEVLDLGTGTGIIPILLEAKTEASHFCALEIQEESADMARRSVALNGLEAKIEVVTGDLKEASGIFSKNRFDVVTCNPPYMIGNHGLASDNSRKQIARHEVLCTFEDVAREAAACLKPGGTFYLVHRPFRLPDIFESLRAHGLEPKRMKLVQPYVDKEPNLVLLEAAKGGKPRLSVEAALIVYNDDGTYTDEIYDIYKPAEYDDRSRNASDGGKEES